MDFWLSDASGTKLRFPVPPEQITADTGARMIQVETVALGEFQWPRGVTVAQVSWEGVLPGPGHQNLPGLKGLWKPPRQILTTLEGWRDDGTKLQLLVTETTLNLPVYISQLQHTWQGGHGDCWYQITLVAAREVQALTDQEAASSPAVRRPASGRARRPPPPRPKTYTVRPGDSLWAIAQRVLGDGSRWRDLYNANKSTIGPDPNALKIGEVLRIPQ